MTGDVARAPSPAKNSEPADAVNRASESAPILQDAIPARPHGG